MEKEKTSQEIEWGSGDSQSLPYISAIHQSQKELLPSAFCFFPNSKVIWNIKIPEIILLLLSEGMT